MLTRKEKKMLMSDIAESCSKMVRNAACGICEYHKLKNYSWQEGEYELKKGRKHNDSLDDIWALKDLKHDIWETLNHYWNLRTAYRKLRLTVSPEKRKEFLRNPRGCTHYNCRKSKR